MGMGYFAMEEQVITVEELREKSKAFQDLESDIKVHGVDVESLVYAAQRDDYDEIYELVSEHYGNEDSEEAKAKYTEIAKKLDERMDQFINYFYKEHGVTLNPYFHDSMEQGSRYDYVDGAFFTIDFSDLFIETEAAKALREKGFGFGFKSWVEYG